jgi:hypothetical protein
MEQENGSKPKGWWHTLPGVLTAAAAVITAITGLIVGLHQAGFFANGQDSQESAARVESQASETEPTVGHAVGAKPGMGTLITSEGSVVFDRITDMSLGNRKLTVSQSGATVEIPLDGIKAITFRDGNAIRIDYRDGESEETVFDCYWNLPVTFHNGDREIYYGDCDQFRNVEQIEFHDAK